MNALTMASFLAARGGALPLVGGRASTHTRASVRSTSTSFSVPTVAPRKAMAPSPASSVSLLRPRPAAALSSSSSSINLRRRASSAAAPTRAMSAAAAAPPPSSSFSGSGSGDRDGKDKFSIFAVIRAMAFYVVTLSLAFPLFCTMVVMFPLTYLKDKYRRYALSFVNDVWACVSTWAFFGVEVIGRENLPPVTTPAVYVANHASYLDIYSLFHLRRPFKFISKVSIFLIPIVGWSMYLTGHIALKRTDRKSQMKTLKDCRELLQKGASVLFFPEGTRSLDGTMAEFKKGAFSIAAKENAVVVPITLVGTSDRMRSGREWMLRPGKIRVVVHPPIQGPDADVLCEQSYTTIKQTLADYSSWPLRG